jgi:NADPH2:quinone reductase
MISFGNASGPVPPVALGTLSAKGSIYVQRPTLNTYASRRDWLEEMAADLIDAVTTGKVKIEINQRVPLKDAGLAQAALEARKTTGCTVLLP